MEDSQEILKAEKGGSQQDGNRSSKEKTPKRIIYFASGETLEEFSSEEEDQEEVIHEPFDTASLSWGAYLQFWALQVAAVSFFTCEFLGGKLATLFGLDQPKYQYAIDEHYRAQRMESESDEDGEDVLEMERAVPLDEKQHLEMQNIEYGSLCSKNISTFCQRNTFANVIECEEGRLADQKFNPVPGK
ncbi:protein FAM177B-like [Heteronotia binoei]|uniref:protein FAM177B-like n=1 Tax=Heteronotia binoei TaxID=13085 RepID=UPI0029305A04|nr:protein FAM177B-like [Heteronotia binoei]XP_060115467.1 protein FAM177B-like [Heteronotia binoei]